MIPKGKLLIIGGAEDRGNSHENSDTQDKNKDFKHFEILGELLPDSNKKNYTIEVITTASTEPEEVGADYIKSFKNAGFNSIRVMRIATPVEARDPALVKRVEKAHAVLFSGGDQLRLASILGGSDVVNAIVDKYYNDENFIAAGTSAGAMIMASTMICSGQTNEAMLRGEVQLAPGFGLLKNCIIDTHFVKRGRFGRLSEAVIMNPAYLGIGLGEDTALIIQNGDETDCRGSGNVIIIDGGEVKSTNYIDIDEGQPICIERLIVHVLAQGTRFKLSERCFWECGK